MDSRKLTRLVLVGVVLLSGVGAGLLLDADRHVGLFMILTFGVAVTAGVIEFGLWLLRRSLVRENGTSGGKEPAKPTVVTLALIAVALWVGLSVAVFTGNLKDSSSTPTELTVMFAILSPIVPFASVLVVFLLVAPLWLMLAGFFTAIRDREWVSAAGFFLLVVALALVLGAVYTASGVFEPNWPRLTGRLRYDTMPQVLTFLGLGDGARVIDPEELRNARIMVAGAVVAVIGALGLSRVAAATS